MYRSKNFSGQDLAELALEMSASLDLTDNEAVEEFRETGFRRLADHFVTVQRIPGFAWEQSMIVELGPKGMIPCPADRNKMGMHIIYGGTPHHIRHGYGFWHVNDCDEFCIWTPPRSPDDFATMVVIERDRLPGETDMVAWYCQNCLNLLYCEVHRSGDSDGAWPATAEAMVKAVNNFNNDERLRVCSECRAEHPLAYHLMDLVLCDITPELPEEATARFEW